METQLHMTLVYAQRDCSGMTSTILAAIARAWKGEPWDDVEILSGKVMKPERGKKKTILFGKCMYQANKDNPDIKEMIAIKGCPPRPETVYKALQKAGIEVDPVIFENMDMIPGQSPKFSWLHPARRGTRTHSTGRAW
jgi:hypothetical protein